MRFSFLVLNKYIEKSCEALYYDEILNFMVEYKVIDFGQAHVWDDSGVAAIDKIVLKLEESGKNIQLTGLNKPSSNLVNRLAIHS